MSHYNGLRKNILFCLKFFVLFITLIFIQSCQTKIFNTQTSYERISLNQDNTNQAMDSFILPYRNYINHDLDSILAFVPITLDKTKGQWQTNIGNWMADVCFDKANEVLKSQNLQEIDLCLFNHGGVRSIIPSGFVSARNAFEVMPFENELIVAELNAEAMQELVQTFVSQKKPHPMTGGQFVINTKDELIEFTIKGKKIKPERKYYVLTSDYLSNGGDYMLFFKKSSQLIPLHLKIRDVLIENFKTKDTIIRNTDDRILIVEN